MNDSIDPTQLDQSALQSLLGGSSPSLIPDSLITTMTVGFIVLNVLGVLFFVFYVISLIRKWKVESAVLHMQKDLADIKAQLSNGNPASHESQPTTQPVVTEPIPVTPAGNNRVVANHDDTSPSSDSRLS